VSEIKRSKNSYETLRTFVRLTQMKTAYTTAHTVFNAVFKMFSSIPRLQEVMSVPAPTPDIPADF
jgi:hypothetical protein